MTDREPLPDMTPDQQEAVEKAVSMSIGWARHTMESLLNHAEKVGVPKVIACAELIVEALAGMQYMAGETPESLLETLREPIAMRRQEIEDALTGQDPDNEDEPGEAVH